MTVTQTSEVERPVRVRTERPAGLAAIADVSPLTPLQPGVRVLPDIKAFRLKSGAETGSEFVVKTTQKHALAIRNALFAMDRNYNAGLRYQIEAHGFVEPGARNMKDSVAGDFIPSNE